MVIHNIDPVFDENSEILILGSFPSVKSREYGFFYGHKQNRFWKVTASVFGCKVPQTVEEKKDFLLKNHIALWDVIAECEISASADSSIKNAAANDIGIILNSAKIKAIFVNGKTAEKYYNKYILPKTGISAVCLPSTSPANAAQSVEKLSEKWKAEISRIIR
ncbi:MAG: DNA-deoxyinosine glycosylase [Clostridia bacterium]|nr:DNA-deoxyinosine glycosylase [Clostridia bacterium]